MSRQTLKIVRAKTKGDQRLLMIIFEKILFQTHFYFDSLDN